MDTNTAAEKTLKRRLDEVIDGALFCKKERLQRMDRLEQALLAIRQYPKWQWVTDRVDVEQFSIKWEMGQLADLCLTVQVDSRIYVYSTDNDSFSLLYPTDDIQAALDHVNKVLKARLSLRVLQLEKALKQFSEAQRLSVFLSLWPFALDCEDFQVLDISQYSVRNSHIKVRCKGQEFVVKTTFASQGDSSYCLTFVPYGMENQK